MDLVLTLGILIFSAILHEIAHGFVADRLGDPTARLAGRLTLNPIPHIDPLMSIFVPLILMISGSPIIFGAAKPVPIDPFNLKEGRKDVALVALAGPLTNIVLAVFASFLFKLSPSTLLSNIVFYNLILAVLNLLPIPPLDGSKIFAFLLPERQANLFLSLGSFGMAIILFVLLFWGGFLFKIVDFSSSFLLH